MFTIMTLLVVCVELVFAESDAAPTEIEGNVSPFFWYNEVTGESSWDGANIVEETDPQSGIKYYFDKVRKEASWEQPDEYAWGVSYDDDGREFYYNNKLKLSQYDKPAVLGWVKKDRERYFWYNTHSEESTWELPRDAGIPSEEHKGRYYHIVDGVSTWEKPHAWEAATDPETNQEYYFNTETDTVVWEKPYELSWQKIHVDYVESTEIEI